MTTRGAWPWLLAALAASASCGAGAQDLAGLAPVGRPVVAVVDELRATGLPFAYSTAILRAEFTVQRAPSAVEPVDLVREILAPHQLTLRIVEGLYLIVRAGPRAATQQAGTMVVALRDANSGDAIVLPGFESPSAGLTVSPLADGRLLLSGVATRRYGVTFAAPGFEPTRHSVVLTAAGAEMRVNLNPRTAEIAEVVVTASRYQLLREALSAPFVIDQRAFRQSPDFGDDPLRALHRLPGSAAGGASAKAHVRGGEADDTAIVLNGQRLLDPFHIRDYQSLFSAIDARAIERIEVYTGGFPVRYGDRMGGVVVIDALSPDEPRQTELGMSVFNTSVLSAGTIGEGTGDWLVSARRGNLDRFINEELGAPSYYDFFGELGVNFSSRTRVSANALTAHDRVLLVTESDPSEREQSINDARNTHLWVHWEQQWSGDLESSTTFSSTTFDSRSVGLISDPEKIVATLDDQRNVSVDSVRQHWNLTPGANQDISWGAEYERSAATYDYRSSADYFGFFRTFIGVQPNIRRALTLDVDAATLGLYFADRWQMTPSTTVELGLRSDEYTYVGGPQERKWSPRFSVLQQLGERTDLRVSLGRYNQAQGIHELQVEDGVNEFAPPQRADHAIVGVQHHLNERFWLRAELYRKSLRDLRPRYENLFDPLAIIPELEPDRVRIAPEGGKARGLELSVAYDGGEALEWWASYTRAHVEDRVAGRDVPRAWDQTHAWQAGVALDGPRWDLTAALSVRSGWPTTGLVFDRSNPAAPVLGERNALRLGGFASVDLRAERRLPLRMGFLDIFFELSNATDRENPCCVDFDLDEDADGRPILDQSTDLWLPRLASFGVLWQF